MWRVKFFRVLPTNSRMDPQPLPSTALRRSDRISIAFPLEVAGIDLTGKRFSERTKTTTVSRFGCCLPLPKYLQAGQSIELRRLPTNEKVVGRVIGSVGPVMNTALAEAGLCADIVPAHPKMAALVSTAAETAASILARKRRTQKGGQGCHVAVTLSKR